MGESSRGKATSGLDLKGSGGGGGGGGGEIVEVEGGHIMRSIGRKDRHSKVCTAKGPRDRRVRLAAHTAIQFYDVQDRLGYDRPSKAVDWLIKNAKSAIDELDHLPPWHPTANTAMKEDEDARKKVEEEDNLNDEEKHQQGLNLAHAMTMLGGEDEEHQRLKDSSFLPPPLDSDPIADTIKSFFPTGGASAEPGSSSAQFQRFQSQDLRLSLQSFQDPIFLQQQAHQNYHHHHLPASPVLLSGTPIASFDAAAAAAFWPDHHHHNHHSPELNRFQKLQSWNGDGNASEVGLYSPTQSAAPYHHLHHNQLFPQRGPLQSSNMPSIRAWMDYPSADYDQQQQQGHSHYIHPTSLSGTGYHQPGMSGFSGFHIPARIQGDEEEHDGYSDKPSSASSDSRH